MSWAEDRPIAPRTEWIPYPVIAPNLIYARINAELTAMQIEYLSPVCESDIPEGTEWAGPLEPPKD